MKIMENSYFLEETNNNDFFGVIRANLTFGLDPRSNNIGLSRAST